MAGTPSYSKLGTDLITFCIGLVKDAYPKYIRDLPVEQRSAIKAYLRALLSPQADTQGPLQRLLYRLFTQKATKPGERYRLTAYRFLILHSFREEGNIDWCSTITQHISKLVFLGRSAIYQKIKIRMEEHEEGFFSYAIPDLLWLLAAYLRHNSSSRARRYYCEYLSLQSDFCLSSLYHSRNLLKRISEDEIKQRLSVELVGPPGKRTSVLIRGTLVDLRNIGKMFYILLDEVKKRRTELLHGIDLEKYIQLPDIIVDEVNNNSPGFYFGDVEENNLKEYENLLFKLLDDPQLTSEYLIVTADGGLAPNRKKCLRFLREMESIRSVLGTLIFICSGSPYRGTEFATTCIRNLSGGNVRNARFVGGNIALISGYSKTSFSV